MFRLWFRFCQWIVKVNLGSHLISCNESCNSSIFFPQGYSSFLYLLVPFVIQCALKKLKWMMKLN